MPTNEYSTQASPKKVDEVDQFLEAFASFDEACTKAGGGIPMSALHGMDALQFMKICAKNNVRFYCASAQAARGDE